MDYKEPKTRREAKGRDKEKSSGPYSQKHVRMQEALAAKRAAAGGKAAPTPPQKKPR